MQNRCKIGGAYIIDYKSRTYNPLEAVIIRGRVVIIEGGVDYNPARGRL